MAAASELGGEMAEGWEKQEALLGFLEHVQLASGKVQWSWLLSTASPVVLWPISRSHLGVVASQAPEAPSRCFFPWSWSQASGQAWRRVFSPSLFSLHAAQVVSLKFNLFLVLKTR